MADWLTTWSVWHWLVLGFVLLIGETLVPGVFLLWWGLAAIVTAGVMALVPSLSLTVLAVFYAILAIILSLLWWKYQHSKDNHDQSRTTLNQRDHTLLGKKGTVLEIGSTQSANHLWRVAYLALPDGEVLFEVVDVIVHFFQCIVGHGERRA